MKRIVIILILLALTLKASAQENAAKNAFTAGDYSTAVKLYETAKLTVTDAAHETSISKAMENAKTCANLLEKANKAYNKGQYADAKKHYQSILKYNSSDKFAKQRITVCSEKITIATNQRNQQNECKIALKNGSDDAIKNYIKKYPDSNEVELLNFILQNIDERPKKDNTNKYKQIGDMFADADNKTKAAIWYDKAVALADVEAMYKKAMINNDLTKTDNKTLLVLSATGGYQPAKDMINKHKNNFRYYESVAKKMFEQLGKYQTDLYALVYVHVNKHLYPTNELHLNYYVQYHPSLYTAQSSANDNLIYQYAKILKAYSNNHYKIKDLMNMAASEGNVDAVLWIFNEEIIPKASSTELKEIKAYRTAFDVTYSAYKYETATRRGYMAYIKYMKGLHLTSGEWSDIFYLDCIDKHEKLLARVYRGIRSRSAFKNFKEILGSRNTWDVYVINDIKKNASKYNSSKYTKKIVKKLSKTSTSYTTYNKTNCLTYTLVDSGYCTDVHKYTQHITESRLWK